MPHLPDEVEGRSVLHTARGVHELTLGVDVTAGLTRQTAEVHKGGSLSRRRPPRRGRERESATPPRHGTPAWTRTGTGTRPRRTQAQDSMRHGTELDAW